MKYIDFHTHILPGIDDGAKSLEEAVEMLKVSKKSGAEAVILTPHYDLELPISEFYELCNNSLTALKAQIIKDKDAFPRLLLGAEVLLNKSFSDQEDLKKLCISGTNLLLIELPYDKWQKWHYNEVYNISVKHNIVPVIAHVERYITKAKDFEKLEPLVSVGAKFQINAESFLTFSGRRVIRDLAATGLISAIGSDCHNLTNRSPDITPAIKAFSRKFDDLFMDYIYLKSSTLLSNSEVK